MTLSHNETTLLIELVLNSSRDNSRSKLHKELQRLGRSEPEFCAGVIEHGRGKNFTSDQWADFLSKVPNLLFREEYWLMNKLSERQRQHLKLD